VSPAGTRLRALLARPEPLIFPGVNSALTARLAEVAGFEAVYVSGYALTGLVLAEPDLGRLSITDILSFTRPILEAVDVPVVVDGETGFGHVLNTYKAARELVGAGFAGMQIDDLAAEVCPYIGRPSVLVSIEEMVRRIGAIVEAKAGRDFVIVATTSGEGPDRIERCIAYAEAGAELISAVWRDIDQLRATAEALRDTPARLKAVCFPLLPYPSRAEFQEMGVVAVSYPVELMYVSLKAQKELLVHLRNETTLEDYRDRLIDHDEYLALTRISQSAAVLDKFSPLSAPEIRQ
jgi:methylisocitrate lyase